MTFEFQHAAHPIDTLPSHLRQRSTLILLVLGLLAVFLHATFRFPLQLPGHHGLEWMALLVMARHVSTYRWAATIAACGAAVTAASLPALGFHSPLAPLFYLLPGLCLDLLFLARPTTWRTSTWLIGTLAGLAFASKVLVQWIGFAAFDFPFGAVVRHGLFHVLALHFAFGFAGGAIGNVLLLLKKPHP